MVEITAIAPTAAVQNPEDTGMNEDGLSSSMLPAVGDPAGEDDQQGTKLDIRVDITTQTDEGHEHADRLTQENEDIRLALSGILTKYEEMNAIRTTEAERNFENHKIVCNKRYNVSEEARLELMKENQDLHAEMAKLRAQVQELSRHAGSRNMQMSASASLNPPQTSHDANALEKMRENEYLLDVYGKFTGLQLSVTDLGSLHCVQHLREGVAPLVFELTPCREEETDTMETASKKRETMSKSRRETIAAQSDFLMFDYEPITVPEQLPNYLSHSMLFRQDNTMAFYHRLIQEWM